MSADAKIWQEDDERWYGIHDGQDVGAAPLKNSAYELRTLITDIETELNKGREMRWLLHVYPDGKAGLRGFTY